MPLELVDHFIYLSTNISSTESDVNIHIDALSVMVGNEHDEPSSNPGRDWLHFTQH